MYTHNSVSAIHCLHKWWFHLFCLPAPFESPETSVPPTHILCSFLANASFCKHSQLTPLAVPWVCMLGMMTHMAGVLGRAKDAGLEVRRPGNQLSEGLLLSQCPSSVSALRPMTKLGWILEALVPVWFQIIIFLLFFYQGPVYCIFRCLNLFF